MGASPSGKKGSLSSVNASCHICARWIQAQTKSDVPLLGDEKSISHPPAGYLGTTVRAELHRSAQLASANDCQKGANVVALRTTWIGAFHASRVRGIESPCGGLAYLDT